MRRCLWHEQMLVNSCYGTILRKVNLKAGSFTGRAINPNVSIALFNDSVNCGQPETGAFPWLFSCEERLENMCDNPRLHSGARISNAQKDILADFRARMIPGIRLIQLYVGCLNL